jgi:hypothetical protein
LLSATESAEALSSLFAREPVVDLHALFKTLQTTSRMSVFRRLSSLGYLSSYSHAGRFYTLEKIPDFDRDGLWQRQGVLFSRHGTLKETTLQLVEGSEDGRTHQELRDRLRTRVQNTLLELVREKRISREPFESIFLYLSANEACARAQRARRQQPQQRSVSEVEPFLVVEILLEVVRSASRIPTASVVAARLAARGLQVAPEVVAAVFDQHGLEKKTARSRWRPSKP